MASREQAIMHTSYLAAEHQSLYGASSSLCSTHKHAWSLRENTHEGLEAWLQ